MIASDLIRKSLRNIVVCTCWQIDASQNRGKSDFQDAYVKSLTAAETGSWEMHDLSLHAPLFGSIFAC